MGGIVRRVFGQWSHRGREGESLENVYSLRVIEQPHRPTIITDGWWCLIMFIKFSHYCFGYKRGHHIYLIYTFNKKLNG